MINDEQPDIVVFTGDLVNNYYYEALPYIDTLKKIKAKDGKYSILGNHDYCDYVGWKRDSKEWKNNFKELIKLEQEAGFDLLLNESRVISSGNNKFNLVGVENWGAGNFNKDGNLEKAMKNIVQDAPTILLSHDPSHWSEIVLKSLFNVDLQLSGHTHGMQFGIEIPGFKWSPVQYRYKQWAGLYQEGRSQIYVNRGIGHLGYAGRVGIMPDISILTIKKKYSLLKVFNKITAVKNFWAVTSNKFLHFDFLHIYFNSHKQIKHVFVIGEGVRMYVHIFKLTFAKTKNYLENSSLANVLLRLIKFDVLYLTNSFYYKCSFFCSRTKNRS